MDLLVKAQDLLGKSFIRNYCILEMMKTAADIDVDMLNESVFIRLRNQESFVMLSASDRGEGEMLLKRNIKGEDKAFYTVGEWPILTEGKNVKYHSQCVQLYLPESVPVTEDEEGVISLTEEMAPYIHERYDHNHVISEEYIRERIRTGPAYGIMDQGILAGWVMTHEEGTMGVLTVLPEYRRKGYAQKLNAALVRNLRALGKPCLVHIIKGNTASLALSEKSGMVYSCDVDWIVLE